MRCAIYARVSTSDQSTEMQLEELRTYAGHRAFEIVEEFVDVGQSGSKDRRPALDRLMVAVHERRVDVVLVWKLDRLGRSLRHLVNVLAEMEARGVALVSLRDNLDLSTPAGRLMFQVIGAMAEFERSLIVERVKAGLSAARRRGVRLGGRPVLVNHRKVRDLASKGLSTRAIAAEVGASQATVWRIIAADSQAPASDGVITPAESTVRAAAAERFTD